MTDRQVLMTDPMLMKFVRVYNSYVQNRNPDGISPKTVPGSSHLLGLGLASDMSSLFIEFRFKKREVHAVTGIQVGPSVPDHHHLSCRENIIQPMRVTADGKLVPLSGLRECSVAEEDESENDSPAGDEDE